MARAFDVIAQRLHNHGLAGSGRRSPAEVVSWLGAVQSQDYAGAKWAIGQRAHGTTDDELDRAFDVGVILRTHVLRPTWHFVAPADIRWMLALTAPRVHAVSAYYYRQQELDAKTFARSRSVFERALRDGRHLTRLELKAALTTAGIAADSLRLGLLMMRAELDRVVCSGPRRGKQFTYALLDERAPAARTLEPEAALAELTARYFTSHGPATVRDYVWWSGLTVGDARRGIDLVRPALVQESIDGMTYWLMPTRSAAPAVSSSVHLLPNYDEYGIAYKDRAALIHDGVRGADRQQGVNEFAHLLIVDGRWVGSWKRVIAARSAGIELWPRQKLSVRHRRLVNIEGERYGAFLNRPVQVSWHQ